MRACGWLINRLLLVAVMVSAVPAIAAELNRSDVEPTTDTTPVLELHRGGEIRHLSRADIEGAGPLYASELVSREGMAGRFTGVLLTDFVEAFRLGDARRLRFIAADGYSVFLTPEDMRAKDYLLVTRFQGDPMTLANKGPLRLVVPADEQAVLEGTKSGAEWVWSIVELQAR